MAYIGIAKPYVAKLEDQETRTYSNCFIAGEAIGMDISPEYGENKMYGDNKLCDYRKDIKQAGVKMNTTRMPIIGASVMFGHEINGSHVIYRTSDSANYCGVGFHVTEVTDNGDKYPAIIIYKTKFTESSESYTTKGDSIEYKTPTIEGVASAISGNVWKETRVFDTEEEADEWIQGQLGYKKKCSTPIVNVQAGSYEQSQTVSLTAGTGESIYYTTNGITPTKETGTLYSGEIAVTSSLAIRAIAVKEGNIDSDVSTYEYVIG